MGTYLNPGNSGFAEMIQSGYVDKTGVTRLINRTIGTKKKLTCISRPRRFGKSYTAQMLCAYYDRSCDSSMLFADLEIARDPDYDAHRNQYNVIYLDMTNIMGDNREDGEQKPFISFIIRRVTEDLLKEYPEMPQGESFSNTLVNAVEYSKRPFIMLIDEWDAPIRETPEYEKEYLKFLRTLFKSSSTTSKIFAAAYMTGILPIKKDGSESAL